MLSQWKLVLSAAVMFSPFFGCKSGSGNASESGSIQEKTTTSNNAAKPAGFAPIRIDAGGGAPVTDASGQPWAADTGFTGGDSVDRGEIEIAGTDNPSLYRTEHFGMESFSQQVPNGSYTVKLHFAETYDGAAFEGGRIFDYKVEDQQVSNFDIFKEAKRENTALVKTHNVTVSDGKLDITFTPKENNPAINAIEILPAK